MGYSDDVIYQAAQTAGYLPSDSSASGEGTPTPGPAVSDVEDTPQYSSTDDFIHRQTQGNVDPTKLPASQQKVEPGQKISQSSGQSSSGRGFNEGTYKKFSGPEAELRQNMAHEDEIGAQERARDEAILGQGRGEAVIGAKAVAGAEANLQSAQGQQATLLENINAGFAAEESKINEHYRAEANQVKADYMTALADFRASRMNPDQLWQQGGKGGQLATIAAVFMHDFLGARGVNTSAMDTLNKAIDRNMQAQEAEMRKKGQVAEGFKSLWEMQRAQSASDAEARARVRGFMLESTKQAIISHMSSYQAALATAQGQSAVAKIDEEYAKNLIDVYSHIDTVTNARKAQDIQIWSDKLKNAQEAWANSIKQQEINQKNAPPNPLQDLIFNPQTNKAMGIFQPGIKDTEKEALRKEFSGAADANKIMQRMRELVRSSPTMSDWKGGTRLADTQQQQFDSLRTMLAQRMARATDGRVSWPEIDTFLKSMRPQTWLNQADSDQVMAETIRAWLGGAKSQYSQLAFDLPENDPRRNISAAQEDPFALSNLDTANTITPPKKTYGEEHLDKLESNMGGPQSQEPLSAYEVDQETRQEHNKFVKANPEFDTGTKAGNIRAFEASLIQLRREASGTGPEAERALKDLHNAAAPFFDPLNVNHTPESVFAVMQLHELTTQEDWISRQKAESESAFSKP